MLVEIQALVDTGGPSPRRLSVGPRPRPPGDAAGGAAPPCRRRLHGPGRVRQRRRRRAHQRAGGRPGGDAGDHSRACAASRCRAASSPSAKSAWPARCGRRRAARSGCARRPSSASRVAIVPKANAPKEGAAAEIEGLTIHPVERIEEAMTWSATPVSRGGERRAHRLAARRRVFAVRRAGAPTAGPASPSPRARSCSGCCCTSTARCG